MRRNQGFLSPHSVSKVYSYREAVRPANKIKRILIMLQFKIIGFLFNLIVLLSISQLCATQFEEVHIEQNLYLKMKQPGSVIMKFKVNF